MKPRSANDLAGMMTAALRHQQAGRPRQAESIYRQVLRFVPDHPEVLHYLGLALHQQGKSQDGLPLMRKALRLQPANPVFHNNLGFVLKSLGRPEEAQACHREAIRLQPAFADAWYNLGVALQDQGKDEEAETAYRKAIELRPDHPKSYVNLGQLLKKQNRLEECLKVCEAALLFQPDLPEAYSLLGGALSDLGRYQEAEERLRAALRMIPANPMLHDALGSILADMDRLNEATAAYERAIAIDPTYVDSLAGLGRIGQMQGQHEQALAYFGKALGLQPDCAAAYYGIAHSRKFSEADGIFIAEIERLLNKVNSDNRKALRLHFALGKVFDDRKQFDQAFEHYRAGNALQHKVMNLDRDKHAAHVADLIAAFPRELVRCKSATSGHESELPIFIVGMPRSGTTLTEQIVSSHPAVLGAGELTCIPELATSLKTRFADSRPYPYCVGELDKETVRQLAGDYLQKLPAAPPDKVRVTDKMPGNFMHAGLIAILFRNARIIHCRRDPMDVCLSIYFQLFSRPHHYAYDLGDLGFYYRQYERLMAHWREVLGERLIEVDYEETVENQEAVSRRLIEHCGLEWDDGCLAFHESTRTVKTASQWQVRQPIYKTSKQRWRNYDRYLGPLKEALGLSE